MDLSPSVLQLLLVVTPDWDSVEGLLYLYEKEFFTSEWQPACDPIQVEVGKNGMAFGRGVLNLEEELGLHKKEGDLRSPAGIFELGTAFGDLQHQVYVKNMPYLVITDDLEYIDDPKSVYYNQFVNREVLCDWTSSEKMKDIGSQYALGFVVQHNQKPVKKGMGSAIFFHIWNELNIGTAGCTAMDKKDLKKLLLWIDINKNPRLIQFPKTVNYNNFLITSGV